MDFFAQRIQGVIFVQPTGRFQMLDLVNSVRQKTGNLFDGMISILPIPPEAPPEVTRASLADMNQIYTCNLCYSRIDFFKDLKGLQRFGIDTFILNFFDYYQSIAEATAPFFHVYRIGLVLNLMTSVDDPGCYARDAFLKPGLFKDASEVQLSVLTKFDWLGARFNRWARIQKVVGPNGRDEFLMLLLDYNTEPDPQATIPHDLFERLKETYLDRVNADVIATFSD
jgi:hypothetical protein